MVTRPHEVPRHMEQEIYEAIQIFVKSSPYRWEQHIRYHDEPIWILKLEESQIVKRIQLAVFDEPDGLFFHIIPDHSGLSNKERQELRNKGRDYRIHVPDEFSKDKLVTVLNAIQKMLR